MSAGRAHRSRRLGFTLIEVTVAVALMGVILTNVYLVLSDTRTRFESQSAAKDVDNQAQHTLDRIALAMMGAVSGGLYTSVGAPLSSDSINFTSIIGFENGAPVLSDPQRIALTQDPTRAVSWYQNPGQPGETHVVWAKEVRDFCAGEIPNGIDDNGNGLVDEKGLSFEVEGKMVKITLTIERPGPGGKLVTKSLETRVTCRN